MGAFLVMPMFLSQACSYSLTKTSRVLFVRPAFGSVIAAVLAKLMSPGIAVSNLQLTVGGCTISVVAYGFARGVLLSGATENITGLSVAFVLLQALGGFTVRRLRHHPGFLTYL